MPARPRPSPLTAQELVDEYFIENRTRLLEIAAFLDRLDRADPGVMSRDYRVRSFTEAVALLGDPADRLLRIQRLLSDPTTEPITTLDRKSATGAFDRQHGGRS